MSLFASTVALALGIFITVSPTQAARIWGWKDFESLAPGRKAWYLRWYRVLGILIGVAGILVAVNGIWFN